MKTCHCDNMDRCKMYNAKWSKSDRERQMVYDFTCLFVESEEQNKAKQKQIHRYRKLPVARGEKGRWWEDGQNRWTGQAVQYYHYKIIRHRDLMHSVRNRVNNIVTTLHADRW